MRPPGGLAQALGELGSPSRLGCAFHEHLRVFAFEARRALSICDVGARACLAARPEPRRAAPVRGASRLVGRGARRCRRSADAAAVPCAVIVGDGLAAGLACIASATAAERTSRRAGAPHAHGADRATRATVAHADGADRAAGASHAGAAIAADAAVATDADPRGALQHAAGDPAAAAAVCASDSGATRAGIVGHSAGRASHTADRTAHAAADAHLAALATTHGRWHRTAGAARRGHHDGLAGAGPIRPADAATDASVGRRRAGTRHENPARDARRRAPGDENAACDVRRRATGDQHADDDVRRRAAVNENAARDVRRRAAGSRLGVGRATRGS